MVSQDANRKNNSDVKFCCPGDGRLFSICYVFLQIQHISASRTVSERVLFASLLVEGKLNELVDIFRFVNPNPTV